MDQVGLKSPLREAVPALGLAGCGRPGTSFTWPGLSPRLCTKLLSSPPLQLGQADRCLEMMIIIVTAALCLFSKVL